MHRRRCRRRRRRRRCRRRRRLLIPLIPFNRLFYRLKTHFHIQLVSTLIILHFFLFRCRSFLILNPAMILITD